MLTKKNEMNPAKSPIKQNSSCCSGHDGCAPSTEHISPTTKTQQKTRVTIRYDVGFSNQLFIRGKGANLSWEKGQPLKNIKADEWQWETDTYFTQCEFKVLVNDRDYEKGENHLLNCGSSVIYTPKF